MFKNFKKHIEAQLDEIRSGGLYKDERIIASPQDAKIKVAGG
ncbi:MAG: glycine C-acetyltransferase, partial [Planctomycetota bacterium]